MSKSQEIMSIAFYGKQTIIKQNFVGKLKISRWGNYPRLSVGGTSAMIWILTEERDLGYKESVERGLRCWP